MKLAICLFVCMIAAAQAAIPENFRRAGAAGETRGAWAGPMPGGGVESGIQGDGGMSSYTVVSGRKHEYTYGRTLSHECTGKGRYKAIIEYTSVTLAGKVSTYRVCEVGHVDLAAGIYRWNDSQEECPKTLKYVLTRSSPWEAATAYSCK